MTSSKKETQRLEETFDFVLNHEAIVNMMNDSDVLLDDGTVSEDQMFHVVLKTQAGNEIWLRDMKSTDKLIFRFKKVIISSSETEFTDIDVS